MGHGLLDDRVVIITGAGQGIGRAIARAFADEGAALALIEMNAQALAETEAELQGGGHRARAYTLDVTDYEAYGRAISDVARQWGHIDVLVNNAAIVRYATILEDSLADWRKQIGVDLEAVYMGTKMTVPHMVERRHGCIISISSIQGFVSSGRYGAYNAAKAGIIGLTKSLAYELAPYGIVANAIAPGIIRSGMSFVDGVDETTTEDFLVWYYEKRHVPMARAGQPDDVAGAAVFLASEYCRYMTGQVLVVDGGLTSTV